MRCQRPVPIPSWDEITANYEHLPCNWYVDEYGWTRGQPEHCHEYASSGTIPIDVCGGFCSRTYGVVGVVRHVPSNSDIQEQNEEKPGFVFWK
jgi:hypothetical protein